MWHIIIVKMVDFTDKTFLAALFFMFFNPFFWNVMGRLEYKKKILTRLFRGDSKAACYSFALCIFSLGLVRDYLYNVFTLYCLIFLKVS